MIQKNLSKVFRCTCFKRMDLSLVVGAITRRLNSLLVFQYIISLSRVEHVASDQ